MHELPRGLAKSLRSWRGSVIRDGSDLEKAEAFEPDEFDKTLHGTSSSLILHPTRSSHRLQQNTADNARRQEFNDDYEDAAATAPSQQHADRNVQGRAGVSDLSERDRIVVVQRRQATFDVQTPTSNKRSVFDQPKVTDPDGAASRLDDNLTPLALDNFYELLGMRPPKAKNVNPRRFAVTNGLYAKIKNSHDHINFQYRTFDVLTYVMLAIQLLLSAVFIVLGSLSGGEWHVEIAVLGAVSTIVAGMLALMKGQGLPNRLRQGRDGLRNVLLEAEELYWDVGAGKSVVYKDIKKVREDYLRVMEDQRRNHPDTWNAYSVGIAEGVRPQKKQAVAPEAMPAPGR